MGFQIKAAVLLLAAGAAGSRHAASSEQADWKLSLGPGAQTLPVYPGSRQLHTVWFPYLDAEYADRIYSNASDLLGVYAYKTADTQVGSAFEYDLTSRDASRVPELPTVRRTTRFKLFASETASFITVDGNIARDAAGHHEGTVGQTNLWASMPLGSAFLLSAGPGLAWGDRQYMQTFFTLPPYFARAGVSDAHLNGLAQWQISSRYQIGLLACAAHLRGSALQSPVSVQHEQTTLTGWIAYRIR